jgi:hypothetical protein
MALDLEATSDEPLDRKSAGLRGGALANTASNDFYNRHAYIARYRSLERRRRGTVRRGMDEIRAVHVAFVEASSAEVDSASAAAFAAGATGSGTRAVAAKDRCSSRSRKSGTLHAGFARDAFGLS